MKIALITEMPVEHFPFWNDGLRAAVDILNEKYGHEVDVFNIPSLKHSNIPDTYDFCLFWGALNRLQHSHRLFKYQGLLFGGGPTTHDYLKNFDIVFAESKIDLEDFKNQGINAVQAFGTNTRLFKPRNQPKVIKFFYPAAFAEWKRHDKFAKLVKEFGAEGQSVAIGYMQPKDWEKECYEICLENGIVVFPWVPPETLAWMYNASENVLITADEHGGSQRCILEAKASGTNVIVASDSRKLTELKDLTMTEVLHDWDEASYAKKIHEGILSTFKEEK